MPAQPSPVNRPASVPVQRFKPSNGSAVGVVGLVALTGVLVVTVATERSLLGVRVVLGVGVLMVLVWATMLRPRATAYADRLVLHHAFSDTHLPLVRIDAAVVRHTLNVWLGERRYVCAGIGRSTRAMAKRRKRSRGAMAVLGLEQTDDRMARDDRAAIGTGNDYETFVETRIDDLVRTARRDQRGDPPEVRREWARPELVGLVVTGVGFVASLLV